MTEHELRENLAPGNRVRLIGTETFHPDLIGTVWPVTYVNNERVYCLVAVKGIPIPCLAGEIEYA